MAARKITRQQELLDIKTVLGSRNGRRLLWRLIGKCGVYDVGWEASAKIHFKAGERNIGLFLMSEIIEADSELYLKMQRENIEDFNNKVENINREKEN